VQGEAMLGGWTVRELLDALAERTPAPGGGAAAACAGAFGAALIEMAARFSLAQGDVGAPMADVLERAGELRARLLELGEVELRELLDANAALSTLVPDVEALLVNRVGERRDYFIAPIDRCYELVGLLRVYWRGLSGGTEVWERVGGFFNELRSSARAKPASGLVRA